MNFGARNAYEWAPNIRPHVSGAPSPRNKERYIDGQVGKGYRYQYSPPWEQTNPNMDTDFYRIF